MHFSVSHFLRLIIVLGCLTAKPFELKSQTIAAIAATICDSISASICEDAKTCAAMQRNIYNEEMLKYPTLVVDITDLNKPHQYNEFNYKVNRELLRDCETFQDQFSLLPLSKILDLEGLFNRDQYDSLERIIIEFIHFKKTDLLIISMDNYFPYPDQQTFLNETFVKWKVGKRYSNGGIIILMSKMNNEVIIKGDDEKTDINEAVKHEKVKEEILLPEFNNQDYFKAVYQTIQALQ